MSYSTVEEPVFSVERKNAVPLIDGSTSVQDLGGTVERQIVRFFWITTDELESEIESRVTGDWTLEREPVKTPVIDALEDLFNAEIQLIRYVSSS